MRLCPTCWNAFASPSAAVCAIDGTKLVEPDTDGLVGRQIGQYAIAERLAVGRTGRVFRAVERRRSREVALKVLHGDAAADRKLALRWVERARTNAKLGHGRVVRVFAGDVTPEGLAFVARELIKGPDLATSIKNDGARPARGAAHVARQLALALAQLHRKGIVYEDLRPSGILLQGPPDAEDVLLVDGAATVLFRPGAMGAGAQDALWARAPAYVAPEQLRGEPATERTDLYLLGVVLYELLIGVAPFTTASAHLEAEIPVPALDYGGLTKILVELLARDPAARPASAEDVGAAIGTLGFSLLPAKLRGRSSPAAEPPPHATPSRRSRSVKPVALAAAGAALLGGLALALGSRATHDPESTPPSPEFQVAEIAVPPALESPTGAQDGVLAAVEPTVAPPLALPPESRTEEGATEAARSAAAPEGPAAALAASPPPTPAERAGADLAAAPERTKPAAPGAPAAPATQAGDADAFAAFNAKDLELGEALSARDLVWDDLAKVEPKLSRRWSRWYRRVEPPAEEELSATYDALVQAVDKALREKVRAQKKLQRRPQREGDAPASDAPSEPREAEAKTAPKGEPETRPSGGDDTPPPERKVEAAPPTQESAGPE